MDGVLIDSEHHYRRMNLKLFSDLGVHISDEEYDGFIGIAASSMWQYIIDKGNLSQSVEELKEKEKNAKYDLLKSGEVSLMDGMPALLGKAQALGLKMAVASSSPKPNIELILKQTGIDHFFHSMISGEEVPKGKPAPDIFIKAAHSVQTAPENCLVIEDSGNGAKAAAAANISCIGFISPHSGDQDFSSCQWIVDSPSKMLNIIQKNLK